MNIIKSIKATAMALLLAVFLIPSGASAAITVNGENFNTHSGDDYKGINVGFNIAGDDPLTSVKVSLLDDEDKVLVTNTGTSELIGLYETGTRVFSTPFITHTGTYDLGDPYWQFGAWTKYEKPSAAQVTVNDQTIKLTTLTEPDGVTWDSILPVVNGENFNTHSGDDYEGVNVGFNLAGFTQISSVTVSLLDAGGKTIVTNKGTEALFNLYNSGENQFSTPFIIPDGDKIPEDEYWKFGNWNSYETPVTALITVDGITTEIEDLTEANGIEFANLVPEKPKTKEACKNGGWNAYYKNQGECVSSFTSKNKNQSFFSRALNIFR